MKVCKKCGHQFWSSEPTDICSECRRKRPKRDVVVDVKKLCSKCEAEMTPYFYRSDVGFGVRWSCPKGCCYTPSAMWKFNVRDSGVESPDGWRTLGVMVAELESPIPLLHFFFDDVEVKLDRYQEVAVVKGWVKKQLEN